MHTQSAMLNSFLTMGFGGPNNYTGKDLREAHKHLGMNDGHFDALCEHIDGLLKELNAPEDVISEITEAIPLGIIPDDADCANAAIFFASDLSRVITGAGLDVNGGEFMPPA